MWTHAPSWKPAFDELLAKGGIGAPVAGGTDEVPPLFASFVDGARGPQHGSTQRAGQAGISPESLRAETGADCRVPRRAVTHSWKAAMWCSLGTRTPPFA
jgi:hypothetical protein